MARSRVWTILIGLVAGATLASSTPTAVVPEVDLVRRYDISALRSDPVPERPTVDVVIIHSAQAEVSWPQLREELREAQRIYERYGVHLNLLDALEIRYPIQWDGVPIEYVTREPRGELDFYEQLDFVEPKLHPTAEQVLGAFVDHAEHPGRVIYVVTLSDLVVSWFEREPSGRWVSVSSSTSAVSFPPYMFADRIPERLRGVISLQRSKPGRKTMAHELGHKLINVSHEGLSACPRGSGESVPGLMGYGDSKEIFGGREGRWHRERLLRSPFIYRLRDGEKVWNEDFAAGGRYDDPIYEDLVVEPACPGPYDQAAR